ncbi:dGTP triphosphohydrolase [Neorhodopirellula pilleata]|uniref:dGTP triphosphohydrolase n=1 Tax=Neorhodopirellula pilleata TaxID=2714738 RepID=UPI0011B4D636|nr:dNTP triphosphohydrolase [Neorhodopirellula pilleata]
MIDLRRYADREHLLLASYAMHSRDTEGRVHPEPPHAYRGPFGRDRDRILHSSAFRRLSGKMQVFTGEMGTYHRTRLTHTFEVASVARTIARVLRLNEDLTEALALLHDIGHPPFGHCGEDVLSECMAEVGGFSHNQFALTIVEQLEQRYHAFSGLNLSAETLAGQDTRAHKSEAAIGRAPLLEVQIVDLADSIAYDAHDVDDALQMGLLSVESLMQLGIIQRAMDRVRQKSSESTGRLTRISADPSKMEILGNPMRQLLVHELIDLQVSDLLKNSLEQLQVAEGMSADQVRDAGIRVGHSDEVMRERIELEQFLFDAVYRHPRLMPVRESAADRVATLFSALKAAPMRLPMRFRRRAETMPFVRVIGEYIAGMTDGFCDQQFENLSQSSHGPLADW